MLYGVLRAAAGIALPWYYGGLLVQGREHVPPRGPLLIVANHPNALVDAMLVTTTVPRRVLITAKATLFAHPLLAPLLHAVGVVPLRRASDEARRERSSAMADATDIPRARNDGTFQRVVDALRHDRVVMVFPEGISHDAPSLAPIRTGAARMALDARAAGVRGVRVLAIGLMYEEKERPRSRILVRIGAPLDLDDWCDTERMTPTSGPVTALTAEIDRMLRTVTLNFASDARAARAVQVARALAATIAPLPSLSQSTTLTVEAELATRVERVTSALVGAAPELVAQADALATRFARLERLLTDRGASLEHARISTSTTGGLRFVAREGLLTILAAPIALCGRLAHWIPLQVARRSALASLADDPSRDQPAMRTIVFAFGALLLWYGATVSMIAAWAGPIAAAIWLVLLLLSARVDVLFADRLARVHARSGTYFAFRADPGLQAAALDEMNALLIAARALELALELETVLPRAD